MKEAVIISGARTAIGNLSGALESFDPVELGIFAFKGAFEKGGIKPDDIQEVIAGHCNQSSSPGNSARHIPLKTGCPLEPGAFPVHQ